MENDVKWTGNTLLFFGSHCIAVCIKRNEPWFLVKDVGRMLEIKNIRQRLKYLDDDDLRVCWAYTKVGRRKVKVVNEAGLYRLVFESRTKEAEKFKRWIAREVLPAIRRTGRYEHRKRAPSRIFSEKSLSGTDTLRIVMREYPGHIIPLELIEPDNVQTGEK
jgi:prophage antirepressor-like protein